MRSFRLSEKESHRLSELLLRFRHEGAMNLEEVDGFFAALVCAPTMVPPSGYMPEILGDERQKPVWESVEEAQSFFDLTLHYWNDVVTRLSSGKTFAPLLLKHSDGLSYGNDWARGFMRGIALAEEDWREFLCDENRFALMIPILALYHEHDPDPEMRPYAEPVSAELREKLLVGLAASAMEIYRHMAAAREMNIHASVAGAESAHHSKIGRNEPCPCGSGKKYKRCCGSATIH